MISDTAVQLAATFAEKVVPNVWPVANGGRYFSREQFFNGPQMVGQASGNSRDTLQPALTALSQIESDL